MPEPDDLAALVAELERFKEAATHISTAYMRLALLKAHEPYVPRILAALKQAREREQQVAELRAALEKMNSRFISAMTNGEGYLDAVDDNDLVQNTRDLLARTAPPPETDHEKA